MKRLMGLVIFMMGLSSLGSPCEGQNQVKEGVEQEKRKVVFLAGRPSHGYGAHEHHAGCVLLAKKLEEGMPNITAEVYKYEWPEDQAAFDDVDCVVMYADGGGGHPALKHLEFLDSLAEKGVGIVCLHYAVEVPKGEPGKAFLNLIGGYFETDWSVNPHWIAKFETLPNHPISRGVEPFAIQDEWYYHMRFREDMEGVTPILSATPTADTLTRPDGPHSGNPYVRDEVAKGMAQHVAWASERSNGARGFGFTGGHDHWNWGDDNFRKVVLNGIVWAAKGEVPSHGVGGKNVDLTALKENQDYDKPENYDWERAKARISHGTQPGIND